MDAITRHSIFLGSSSIGLLQRLRSQPISRIFFEVAIIALFFAFTVKTENWFSQYLFQPLIKRLFGDNEDLKRELDEQEAFLTRMLEEYKKQANSRNQTLPGPIERLAKDPNNNSIESESNRK